MRVKEEVRSAYKDYFGNLNFREDGEVAELNFVGRAE